MNYPIFSYFAAILIYLSALILCGINFSKKPQQPAISLEIDADFIGDFNQHQQSSNSTQKSAVKIPDNSKNSPKNSQEKIEPHSQKHDENQHSHQHLEAQKIVPLYQPLPEIPEDMRREIFSSKIVAKFFINQNGEVARVELLEFSANPRLNALLLKSLHKWKFEKTNREFTQVISVNFKVE